MLATVFDINIAIKCHSMYVLEFKNIEPIVSNKHVVYSINIEHRVQDTLVKQVIVALLDRVDEFTCE